MQVVSLVLGILAILGMLVGFIPCLGALNWLNIPFALIGILVSAIAMSGAGEKNRTLSVIGLVCCIVAVLFGLARLVLGGGIL